MDSVFLRVTLHITKQPDDLRLFEKGSRTSRMLMLDLSDKLRPTLDTSQALRVQHDRNVNKNRMAFMLVSIDSVWLFQLCLLFQLMKMKSV